MDRLRQVLNTITKNLGRLTASQRLLIGSLAVVMGLVLFMVYQYGAKPALVPLLPGAPAETQQRAVQFLNAAHVDFQMPAGEVMVPPDVKYTVLAQMADQRALPNDNSILFDNLIKKYSWTLTQQQNHQIEMIAVQNELAHIIGRMRGVRSASVLIDVPDSRALGQPNRAPTATATLFTEGGLDQNTVDAVAHLVAGSRAGLDVRSVRVIDATSNRQFRARDENSYSASTYQEYVAGVEERKQRQLYDMLSAYIPGVVVSVHAQVDNTSRRTETKTVSPDGKGSAAIVSRETTTETSDVQASSGGEPGARSNVGDSIVSGGGGAAGSRSTQGETEFSVEFGTKLESIIDPRGMPTKINAVVNIPRAYFVELWKAGKPKADAPADAEPADADLQPVIQAEIARISKEVLLQIDTSAGPASMTGEVSVSMIPLVLATTSGGATAGGLLSMGGGTLVMGDLAKTAALGGLALAALGLMVVTALKASKREPLPSAEELVGVPPALSNATDLVGEASAADSVLAGVELDDEDIKHRKIIEQVGELVKEKPQEAASLLGRWMSAEH